MLVLLSPAKINLFLRILRRRADGYHEMASLFQAISLCDTLTFSLCRGVDRLVCSDPAIPVDRRNLVAKALHLYRQRAGFDFSIEIAIDKKIPSQAGLGGGSSNAATTLWGLNALFGHPIALSQLKEWGAEIGSDVPFFLSMGTAYCTGRGEVMRALPPLKFLPKLSVTKPPFGMPTANVYQNLDVSQLPLRHPDSDLEQFLQGNLTFYNDLELPAFALDPRLKDFKRSLQTDDVLMSGSGSAFFCFAEKKVFPPDVWHIPVSAINRSEGFWYETGDNL